MPVDYQALLDRRAAVAEEMVQVIGRLGALAREEIELRTQLSRLQRAAGSVALPFSTQPTTMDAINSELTRAGLALNRADPSNRLNDLVHSQNARYRSQMMTVMSARKQAGTPAAA
jgi:hypothetical protein